MLACTLLSLTEYMKIEYNVMGKFFDQKAKNHKKNLVSVRYKKFSTKEAATKIKYMYRAISLPFQHTVYAAAT